MVSLIASMTPQPYPLSCRTERPGRWYLVLGWTADDLPVVVRETQGYEHEVARPEVLSGEVSYCLPEMKVTIDGKVEAVVEGSVRSTVSGIERNEAIKVITD